MNSRPRGPEPRALPRLRYAPTQGALPCRQTPLLAIPILERSWSDLRSGPYLGGIEWRRADGRGRSRVSTRRPLGRDAKTGKTRRPSSTWHLMQHTPAEYPVAGLSSLKGQEPGFGSNEPRRLAACWRRCASAASARNSAAMDTRPKKTPGAKSGPGMCKRVEPHRGGAAHRTTSVPGGRTEFARGRRGRSASRFGRRRRAGGPRHPQPGGRSSTSAHFNPFAGQPNESGPGWNSALPSGVRWMRRMDSCAPGAVDPGPSGGGHVGRAGGEERRW